jgi:F-type H+-transporting ATPase subunit b
VTPARSSHYRRASLVATVAAIAAIVLASDVPLAAAAEGEGSGWGATIAKAVNFAILIGVLLYFLKTPIVQYLKSRGETIRKDLVDAASLRATAEQQLADVRTRLSALPAELDALRRRGEAELAAERGRLADATVREKAKVLDRTQREIDSQLRLARRNLTEHAAELAMTLARKRIERDITAEDQARLIDRYASEVRA